MQEEMSNENGRDTGSGRKRSMNSGRKNSSVITLKVIIVILIVLILALGGYVGMQFWNNNEKRGIEIETPGTLVQDVDEEVDTEIEEEVSPVKEEMKEVKVVTDTVIMVVTDTVRIPEPEVIAVQQIAIVPSTLVLSRGEQFALQFVIIPKNATNHTVFWSSSMPDVVKVDEDGVVTAEHSGNAVIRVTSEDGGHVADCRVFVEKGKIEVVSDRELKLPYGSYKGEIKNAKAHGMGTVYYDVETRISPFDDKVRMAAPGDYVSGEFHEGQLVQGKWFAKDGKQKGTLIIGRAR
jgi:serine/threonine kinase